MEGELAAILVRGEALNAAFVGVRQGFNALWEGVEQGYFGGVDVFPARKPGFRGYWVRGRRAYDVVCEGHLAGDRCWGRDRTKDRTTRADSAGRRNALAGGLRSLDKRSPPAISAREVK